MCQFQQNKGNITEIVHFIAYLSHFKTYLVLQRVQKYEPYKTEAQNNFEKLFFQENKLKISFLF